MKKIKFISILTVAIFSFLFASCDKKNAKKGSNENFELKIVEKIEAKKNHAWYFFTESGYEKIDKIQNVSKKKFKPWTEAVRISSANCAQENAFAVVNRLGVLCFENENIYFAKDANLFSQRTAGNLVFLNETPVFSLYKSSFFNDSVKSDEYKNDSENHLFLAQFDNEAKISYPLINCNNISKIPNSEVTDFVWDGLNWLCSVKSIEEYQTVFSYVSFAPTVSLLSLSPATANGNLRVAESSAENFRNAKQQIEYSFAPERVKSILAGFSKEIPFSIEVKTAGGCSPRKFSNAPNETEPLKAKAILAESWSAALFEDGTMFIEGALPGKHILRGGKPVAVRLPILPQNFVYSDFVISGTSLYAAWEEISFYETGASGFIYVNLENTLYKFQ